VQFSSRFIRSVIRQVWNQAPNGAQTFYQALEAGASGYWEQVGTGWQVQSSSGAGYQTSFHIASSPYDPNQVTPKDFQELFELILEKYQIVYQVFGVKEDEGTDFMNSVFCKELCHHHFPIIKGYTNNFTYALP
jgi:hypothetical protein